jgi:predicted esterase
MNAKLLFCCFVIAMLAQTARNQSDNIGLNLKADIDYVAAFKDTLNSMSNKSDNDFFKMHCNSIVSVINSKSYLTNPDLLTIEKAYNVFNNNLDPSNSKLLSTYLKRERPFILSWVSPTDGKTSLSYLTLPIDWDPEKEYPLYIRLHGYYDGYTEPIDYMMIPYLGAPSSSFSFEDGYLLMPWGRGNLWYEGISETDIWECIAALEEVTNIDPYRKYLFGFSMGGYGAWSIASKSPDTWAAMGIMAGALWYGSENLVTVSVAHSLVNLPTYFICGTQDGLLPVNEEAYNLLQDEGNPDTEFVTFQGGHEYVISCVEDMYLWMKGFTNDDPVIGLIDPILTLQNGNQVGSYPNPVHTSTTISFKMHEKSEVNIAIYDLYGRLISVLLNGVKSAGEYNIEYDASGLASALYVVKMKSGNVVSESKMLVVR